MGLLDILNGMQNGPRGPSAPAGGSGKGGMSPITMAILALLAYKGIKHMTGGQPQTAPAGGNASLDQASLPGGGLSDLLKGGLGGALAGGAAGSILGGGLNDLLKQLQDGGQKDAADSWVSKGPNKEIAPNDLAGALGADQIRTMMDQSGLSKQELLEGLSQYLPGMVDQLTPDGRMPSADELRRLL
jgi:uncharacterized protein YidB (DUF937 family)